MEYIQFLIIAIGIFIIYMIIYYRKYMKITKAILYVGLNILFFLFYYKVLGLLWRFLPWTVVTDVIALFIIIFINLPLTIISTEKTMELINK